MQRDLDSGLDIGNAVAGIRLSRGLTQVQLAKVSGISQAQLSRLENNREGLCSNTAFLLAAALKVKPFLFFMGPSERARAWAIFCR